MPSSHVIVRPLDSVPSLPWPLTALPKGGLRCAICHFGSSLFPLAFVTVHPKDDNNLAARD